MVKTFVCTWRCACSAGIGWIQPDKSQTVASSHSAALLGEGRPICSGQTKKSQRAHCCECKTGAAERALNNYSHDSHARTEWMVHSWVTGVCACMHRRDATLYSISVTHTCVPVICSEREHTCWVFVILNNLESDCVPIGIENLSCYHFHPGMD